MLEDSKHPFIFGTCTHPPKKEFFGFHYFAGTLVSHSKKLRDVCTDVDEAFHYLGKDSIDSVHSIGIFKWTLNAGFSCQRQEQLTPQTTYPPSQLAHPICPMLYFDPTAYPLHWSVIVRFLMVLLQAILPFRRIQASLKFLLKCVGSGHWHC